MSTTKVPQHLDALATANARRIERATMKREVRAKTRRLAAIIVTPPDSCATATIGDVLTWMPRVGPGRALRLMRDAARHAAPPFPAPSEARRLGELTLRQRRAIATAVTALEEEYVIDDLSLDFAVEAA